MNICVGICVYITKYAGNVCILSVMSLVSAGNTVMFLSCIRCGLLPRLHFEGNSCEFVQYLEIIMSNTHVKQRADKQKHSVIGFGYCLPLLELAFFHPLF